MIQIFRLGEVRLDRDSCLEVPRKSGQVADHDGAAGLHSLHQVLPARPLESGTRDVVDEDEVPADAVPLQRVGLRLQVLLVLGRLGDRGIAVSDGDNGAAHVVWKELYLVVPRARIA